MTTKIKFATAYAPLPSVPEKECPQELQDYKYNKATRELEPTKKIEFYKEIQSHYESTKLSTKLQRYAMGDTAALGFPSGTFGDFADLPTNLATVLNAKQTAQESFSKLPSELRQLFNNDFTEFIRSVENGTYQQRLVEYAAAHGGSNGGTAAAGTEPAPSGDSGGDK